MAKKTSRSRAKEKAWTAFSIFIRTRDCLSSTGDPERGVCVTCKREFPFKKLQAGHFIAGRGNAVLFDERQVHAQCYGCNVGRGGAHVEYFVFMEQKYGRDMIDEFRAMKNTTKIYKEFDFVQLEQEFKDKTAQLLSDFKRFG